MADDAPFGCHSAKPGADQIVEREQIELLAERAVIAALGLFELREVLVELGLAMAKAVP